MNILRIKIGSRWERIASGNVWTVKDINPNGTVTAHLQCGLHCETETYETDFFVGAFRKLPSENPRARIHNGN